MTVGRVAGAVAVALTLTGAAMAEPRHTLLDWDDLSGWAEDDHAAALSVFLETCGDMRDPEWGPVCAFADHNRDDPRGFFELFFRPVLVEDGAEGLFTGYYEPELQGSRTRTGSFRHPLYRTPPEVRPGERWFSRAEIEDGGYLEGRGLELVWLSDPVEKFFLQIQGSGRIRLTDGSAMRVGYGGRNGHDYRSVGRELVRRGVFESHQVSAAVIKRWVRNNPVEGRLLLQHNPSYIFFREVTEVPSDRGPLGAMNRSVTPMRSIAVDPEYVPLGAPVWIETRGRERLNRLMIAQDTGSAIKGAQRADVFVGTGQAAGRKAGRMRDPGRMVVLLPIDTAFALAPEG